MNLTDKHIIITGGSSGMGMGIAKMALASGAKVSIVGRAKEKLDKAKNLLSPTEMLNTIVADITSESDVVKMFETSGNFHYLINTAADVTNTYRPITELDITSAKKAIDSKLVAAILLAKHGSKKIDSKGAFVFTSGIAAYRPSLNGTVISAVNGSLSALARALAIELAPVRVNVVSPGWVDTPIWEAVAGDKKEALLKQKAKELPVGKIGEPEDIAQAVLSIIQNQYITGTVLHVDGGQRLV